MAVPGLCPMPRPRMIGLLAPLALCASCAHPDADLVAREATWADADQVEAELGIDLAELPGGEPLGAWPRVVIRRDGIDLDTRAPWLALDPEQRAALGPSEQKALLVEQPGLVPLDGGALVAGQVDEVRRTALHARHGMGGAPGSLQSLRVGLSAYSEALDALDLPGPRYGPVVVPDAMVPWASVQAALQAAWAAGWPRATVAGRVGPRLRSPWAEADAAHADDSCLKMVAAQTVDGLQLRTAGGARDEAVPPIGGPGPACALVAPAAVGATLQDLAARCAAFDAAPSCLRVTFLPHDEVPAGAVLTAMAGVYAGWPELRAGTVAMAQEWVDPLPCATPLDSLDQASLARLCLPPPPVPATGEEDLLDLFSDEGSDIMTLDQALETVGKEP
jgi:hypothetical protein